jgi:phosphatidylglycerophosphate synthase
MNVPCPSPVPHDLRRRAGVEFALTGSLTVLAGAVHSPSFVAASAATYAAIAVLAIAGLARHAPHRRLGGANRVTLIRAALTSLFAGAFATAPLLSAAELWLLATIATLSLALDGLDGHLARRSRTSSAFGALFDQEVDALLILLMSLLVWRLGHAGAEVLAIGLMRYAFLAWGWLKPAFRRPLPPSLRRKAVCVVQVVVLIACLPPLLPGAIREAAALTALILLAGSFGADLVWLGRRASEPVTS